MDKETEEVKFSDLLKKARNYKENQQSYHYLIQCLLKKSSLTQKHFYVLWMRYIVEAVLGREYSDFAKIKCNAEELDELTRTLIENVNRNISKLGMRVTEYPNELTGKRFVVLITETSFSNCLQLASKITEDQKYLLTLFLEEIVKSEEGYFDRNWAAARGTELPNVIGPIKMEAFLRKMVGEFWLEENEGKFSLGVRGAAELSNLLMRKYNAPGCSICDRLITRRNHSVQCPNCEESSHRFCFQMMSIVQRGDSVECPSCKKPIDKKLLEGKRKNKIKSLSHHDLEEESDEDS